LKQPFLENLTEEMKQGSQNMEYKIVELRERNALLKQEEIQKKNELKLLDERLTTRNFLEQKQTKTYQEVQKYDDEISADKEATEKLKSDATNLVHETRKKAEDKKNVSCACLLI
jgi:chromosome segregation ATPase